MILEQIAGPDSQGARTGLLADLGQTPQQTVEQLLREVMKFDPDPALAGYRARSCP